MSNELDLAADADKDANGKPCRSQGFDLTKDFRPRVKIDLIGGSHKLNQFLTPEQGHKHVSLSNPTPDSVKPLLEKMKEPSTLVLRGCELLLQPHYFPFENFKALTSLEISGISYLTTVPDAVSEMTQLQALDLSHLPIKQFPSDQFFSKLRNLRSVVLRGCYNLHSLPTIPRLPALQCLDLSHLLIETIPFRDEFYYCNDLRWLILRGCSRLCSLPDLDFFKKLEVLDVSHCTTLQEIEFIHLLHHDRLQMLDLSYTALPYISLDQCPNLTHLFARDIKVIDFGYSQIGHSVLDLCRVESLVAIVLSRIEIQSIDSLSNMIHLRHLVLKECIQLVNLPEMKRLTHLKVLDISGCKILADLPEDLNSLKNIQELNLSGCSSLTELREGLFDDLSCLEKLDLSKTNINHLPSFATLTSLRTLNLSHTSVEKLPNLPNLKNLNELLLENCPKLEDTPDIQRLANLDKLDLSLPGNDGIDLLGIQSSGFGNLQEKTHLLGRISNPDEFHLVSTFIGESGFDRFKYEFRKLEDLISNIEKKTKPTSLEKIIAANTTNKMSQDLQYILKNIDLLESSSNCRSSEELLHELMNATTVLSDDDFSVDSIDVSELIRVIAKLKLLVPPPKQEGGEEENEKNKMMKKKKKKIVFTINKDNAEVVEPSTLKKQSLISSYDSLTDIQKKCLLYFVAFSYPKYRKSLKIKGRMLIHLWYGEGFIDPGLARNDASGQVPTTKGVENPNTIEEIGQQILKVLEEKEFILFEIGRICYMRDYVRDFVKEQANKSFFFDFNQKNMNLTSHFTNSQRACLLKSQAHCLSSCQLWLSYTNSSKKLERFKNIHTLLHVNESIIDLNVQWFSKMRNLIVLHLGSLNFEDEEHIDFVDLKFLHELKNMTLLRLLSLEGFSAIVKLPDSVCMLTNLRMLNLRYCCNLEELPAGIGSLEKLTHLDLTHCHLLSMLPKGLALLSRLEVLKGFVITYGVDGQQHTKTCTLSELLKLKKLRKLNLVVNRDKFPYSKDLHVFKKMKNLCNLQITWKNNCYEDQEPEDAIGHEALRHSRWKQLKCWKQQARQSDTEEPLKSNRLHDLRKLVMCCFPSENPPNWLHPSEFQKLEKLYIVGGNLKTFPGATYQNTWSVSTLRLKYFSNLNYDWPDLKRLFPNVEFVGHTRLN